MFKEIMLIFEQTTAVTKIIYETLHRLVPFAKFWKSEKYPWRECFDIFRGYRSWTLVENGVMELELYHYFEPLGAIHQVRTQNFPKI